MFHRLVHLRHRIALHLLRDGVACILLPSDVVAGDDAVVRLEGDPVSRITLTRGGSLGLPALVFLLAAAHMRRHTALRNFAG